ncbi:MAG TPA: hypothetical protein VFD13_05475 [Candidatus Kapabacteria bacterium]|nr:hypothetical protein [Candidatus Kapabacteria bacterium]
MNRAIPKTVNKSMQNISQKRNRHQPKLSAVKSLTHTRKIQKLEEIGNNSSNTQKRTTATELRKLTEKERAKIIRAAAKKAVEDYLPGGALIWN